MRYIFVVKGYGANRLRRSLRAAGAVPVIPGRRNRNPTIRCDKDLYRVRHPIEKAFHSLKDFRRIDPRYDEFAANLLSGVILKSWRRTARYPHGST